MMVRFALLFAVLCVFSAVECKSRFARPYSARAEWDNDCNSDHIADIVSQGTSDWAIDLLAKTVATNGEETVFLSPASIYLALGIVLQGAENDALDQMAATMRLGALDACLERMHPDMEDFEKQKRIRHEIGWAFLDLAKFLQAGNQTEIANSLWIQDHVKLHASFKVALNRYFGSEYHVCDFHDPAGFKQQVDTWVRKATHGMIPGLGTKPNPHNMLMVINAIYFAAKWQKSFSKKNTHLGDFATTASGNTEDGAVKVHYMKRDGTFQYFQNSVVEAVALPYSFDEKIDGAPRFEAVFVLPDHTSIEKALDHIRSQGSWGQFRSQFRSEKGDVTIPRLEKISTTIELSKTMHAMGLDFNKLAFSNIIRREDIKVSEILHKAVVTMDEEGTTAAAITAITFRGLAVARFRAPFNFVANRPYLVFITEAFSHTILFCGIVTDPTKHSS